MARPTATCGLPPPAGTAKTRSRRAPSVSSYWRAAHSHDSMSTLWLTTTAHSSAVQNRGSGAPGAPVRGRPAGCARTTTRARRPCRCTPTRVFGPEPQTQLIRSVLSSASFRLQWRRGPARCGEDRGVVDRALDRVSRSACYLFIDSLIKASREAALKTVNAEARAEGEAGPVDAGRRRRGRRAVRRQRRGGAVCRRVSKLLAAPYRSAVTPAAFEKALP